MRLLIALLAAASLAWQQAPTDPKPSRLSGRVLTSSGDPVPNVNVTLYLTGGIPPETRATVTNSKGEFLLEDIPQGTYKAPAIGRPGFVPEHDGPRTITLAPGEELRGILLHMTPGGVITGQITDQDGDPAAGAVVMIAQYTYKQGHRSLTYLSKTPADDKGNYRFANRQPGRYYVFARGVREIPTRQKDADFREVEGRTFFPSALDVRDAKPLDLGAGGEIRGADIRLQRSRLYSVHVKMHDSSGSPALGMALEILLRGTDGSVSELGSRSDYQLTDLPDGNFVFADLPAGRYVLRAFPMPARPPDEPQHLVGRLDFDIVDHSLDLDFGLTRGGVIDGTVTFDNPSTIPPMPENRQTVMMLNGQPTAISQTGPRLAFVLREWIGNYEAVVSSSEMQRGTFHLTGLDSGSFLWEVPNLPKGTFVKSIRSGEHDFLNSMIDPSLVNGPLQILIGSKEADITGTAHGQTVTLWPKAPNLGSVSGGIQVADTDQNGAFRFTGLAPGEYYVAAWDDLDPGLAESDDFLRRFNNEASFITVAENEHAKLDPKLIPPEHFAAILKELP